jgi:hypothetical protein
VEVSVVSIKWTPSWRIIADRYPPIDFFDRIADVADWEELLELESLTNPSAKASVGNIYLIPVQDRISGPGAGRILPAFTFLDPNPPGSRFSNSQFGAYYAAKEFITAMAEAKFRQEQFMQESGIKSHQGLDQLIILANIAGDFHDIRGLQNGLTDIYDLNDYNHSQAFATRLRQQGSYGIVYSSVRQQSGECIAVFRPPVITKARQGERIVFQWDGEKITGYYKKSDYQVM